MNQYVVVNGQEYIQITKIKNLRLCNLYELFKILYTGNDHWWTRKL